MTTKDISTLKGRVQRSCDQGDPQGALNLIFDSFPDDKVDDSLDDIGFQSYDSVRDTLLDSLKDSGDSYDVDGAEDAVNDIRKIEASEIEWFNAESGGFEPMADDDLMDLIDNIVDPGDYGA